MSRAVYPGSFDPFTRGHFDVVQRAARLFDELIVAVGVNPAKEPLFDADERVAMAREQTAGLPNVCVDRFEGLMVDFVRSVAPAIILRGLRDAADFEEEFRMAMTNREAGGGVETLFIVPSPRFSFHSAHLIKQIAAGGGDVSEFVADGVARQLRERFARGGRS